MNSTSGETVYSVKKVNPVDWVSVTMTALNVLSQVLEIIMILLIIVWQRTQHNTTHAKLDSIDTFMNKLNVKPVDYDRDADFYFTHSQFPAKTAQ